MSRYLWIFLPLLLATFSIPSSAIRALHEAVVPWSKVISHFFCLVAGITLGLLARYLPYLKSYAVSNADDGRLHNTVYGLEHGKLNVQLPPPTMWMNMGYWEVRLFYFLETLLFLYNGYFTKVCGVYI
jgi:hypothetical protein